VTKATVGGILSTGTRRGPHVLEWDKNKKKTRFFTRKAGAYSRWDCPGVHVSDVPGGKGRGVLSPLRARLAKTLVQEEGKKKRWRWPPGFPKGRPEGTDVKKEKEKKEGTFGVHQRVSCASVKRPRAFVGGAPSFFYTVKAMHSPP